MPGVEEGLEAKSPLASTLAVGVKAISSEQKIVFTKYVKLVLPLDGYVFWVKAELVSPAALANAMVANSLSPNLAATVTQAAPTFAASGSLHYASDEKQTSEASYTVNRVVFTSLVPINDFETVDPNIMYIGTFDGIRFAFSSRKSFYKQADLYHYVGDAVYPIMESQIIDSAAALAPIPQIVSNSMPIWLSMSGAAAQPWEDFGCPIRFYPAFLAEENAIPPFGAVDIPPETSAIAMAPTLGRRLAHNQLVRERVKIVLWGIDNAQAMDFVDYVNQFSLNTDLFGIMNMPAIRDERSPQVELGTLAKKKSITFEINYYQQSCRDLGRQLVLSAVPSYSLNRKPLVA